MYWQRVERLIEDEASIKNKMGWQECICDQIKCLYSTLCNFKIKYNKIMDKDERQRWRRLMYSLNELDHFMWKGI